MPGKRGDEVLTILQQINHARSTSRNKKKIREKEGNKKRFYGDEGVANEFKLQGNTGWGKKRVRGVGTGGKLVGGEGGEQDRAATMKYEKPVKKERENHQLN